MALALKNKISQYFISQGKFLFTAIIAGFFALAYPEPGWHVIAWIVPILLLIMFYNRTTFQRLKLGFITGFVFWSITLRWLLLNPYKPGAIAGWLALSLYLSIYMGLWAGLSFIFSVDSETITAHAVQRNRTFRVTLVSMHILWPLWVACVWVGLEFIRSKLFSGFPWNSLGVTQYKVLPLIQLASITGVYGISFLMVWFAAGTMVVLLKIYKYCKKANECLHSPPSFMFGFNIPGFSALAPVLLPVFAIIVSLAFGFLEIKKFAAQSAESIRFGIVQPSIPQTLIWDATMNYNRFSILLDLSNRVMKEHPDLLIWPEASFPGMIRYDTNMYVSVSNLVNGTRTWLVLGSDDAEPCKHIKSKHQADYYNAAFLINTNGEIYQRYCKQRLVVFGEYVPLVDWLPFLKWLTPIEGGFSPGDGPVIFNTPYVNMGVTICFEDTFADLCRKSVGEKIDLLLNLTNNGWFGESSAHWQHLANAIFRAVENRVPLVRCANNGISCWVDQLGNIRSVLKDNFCNEYGRAVSVFNVQVPKNHPQSFYNKNGDCLAWLCVSIMSIGAMTYGFRRYKSCKK